MSGNPFDSRNATPAQAHSALADADDSEPMPPPPPPPAPRDPELPDHDQLYEAGVGAPGSEMQMNPLHARTDLSSPSAASRDDEEQKLMSASERVNSAGTLPPTRGSFLSSDDPVDFGPSDADPSEESDRYEPPTAGAPPVIPPKRSGASRSSQQSSGEWDLSGARNSVIGNPGVIPSSYSAYEFARPSQSTAGADKGGHEQAAASSSASRKSNPNAHVSATTMEREMLEHGSLDDDSAPVEARRGSVSQRGHGPTDAGAGHGHGLASPPPMLLEYSKSTSSIRRDFTTVDWFFSRSNMHRLRRMFRARNKLDGWKGKLKNMLLAAQGWIILGAVGVCTAVSASIIHSVSAWIGDLKGGYCSGHTFFATRRVCCMDEQVPGAVCQAWKKWSDGVASADSSGGEFWNLLIYVSMAVMFAAAGSWVCVVFARQAAGSGIAELKIILGGFVIKKFLGIRTLLFKSVGLTLAVASGMALGKEGPMVHIACAWGNILSRPFLKYASNEVKKSEVLSAATAAGVTAAFGSPLGGVLFSLEVVSSYFPPKTMWRSFWCAICTALMLQWLDPFQTGHLVQFSVEIKSWQWFEFLPFMILGALGGLMGALFIKLNVFFTKLRKGVPWIRSRPVLEVTCCALLTALISFPNIFSKGNSGSLLAQLFTNCDNIIVTEDDDLNAGKDSVVAALCDHDDAPGHYMALLIVASAVKFLLTTITYGEAIPSGVFMPSLCCGALMGRAMGWGMMLWHKSQGDTGMFSICSGRTDCVTPALYAVIGASAVLGGITRMTLSLAVIMFEVTGGLVTIVPIMVAVVVSKWFADAFGQSGLYGALIELNGLPHIDMQTELDLVNPAAEMMVRDPVCLLTYGQTLQSIKELLETHGFHGFPIIDNAKDRLVTGFISRADLELTMDTVSHVHMSRAADTPCHFSRDPPPFPAPDALDFSSGVDRHPLVVRPSMPADRIMAMFQALGLRYVLCCSPRGRIMGIIKKKNLLYFLMKHNIHHKI